MPVSTCSIGICQGKRLIFSSHKPISYALFNLFLSFFLVIEQLNAQPPFCPVGEEGAEPVTEPPSTECFDVNTIFDNCPDELIYLRVNVHFFLDDNCEGQLDPSGQRPYELDEAYLAAEEYIDAANLQLGDDHYRQWNQSPWGVSTKPKQCVPFRYTLAGVYVHCSSMAFTYDRYQEAPQVHSTYGVNKETEFNLYILPLTNASGVAGGIGGFYAVNSNLDRGLLNHEMGHNLTLEHSWIDDGIDDTPEIHYDADYNCDGDFDDNWRPQGGRREADQQCWRHLTESGANRSIDYDGDGIIDYPDVCYETPIPCGDFDEYPCCQWKYINNNMMAYSNYQNCCGAFTEGQILRMLNHLSQPDVCQNYIVSVSSCVPPIANIAVLSFEDDEEDCKYCIHMEHSVNEDGYQLEIFKVTSLGLELFHSTGWLDGPALTYCIGEDVVKTGQYANGFEAGQPYLARLTVSGECSATDVTEITFSLPFFSEIACELDDDDEPAIEIGNLLPNPTPGSASFDYEILKEGPLNIWLVDVLNQNNTVTIMNSQFHTPGNYQSSIDMSSYNTGTYALIFHVENQIESLTLIKQ